MDQLAFICHALCCHLSYLSLLKLTCPVLLIIGSVDTVSVTLKKSGHKQKGQTSIPSHAHNYQPIETIADATSHAIGSDFQRVVTS